MAIPCIKQPVILIGMSRSGKSLIAGLLQHLGLFIGHRKIRANQESEFFVSVNEMLLKRVHAYWDNPAPMRYFVGNIEAMEQSVRCMEMDLLSPRFAKYLGWKKYLKYRGIGNLDIPWGWEDPRNVFTLPCWLKLFPKAKIIHVVRNGVDVADSLVKLERDVLSRRARRYRKVVAKFSLRSPIKRGGFKSAVRCLTLTGGFSLWEEYIAQAEETLNTINNDRLVVRYEDFLTDTKRYLVELSHFCNLASPTDRGLNALSRTISAKNANAFLADPMAKQFYRDVRNNPWMIFHGYANDAALDQPRGMQ